MRWCDTFAATGAGTLKGKRQAAPRPTLADAAAHERSRESFSTRSAPSKDDLPSGIAHPCRDGA